MKRLILLYVLLLLMFISGRAQNAMTTDDSVTMSLQQIMVDSSMFLTDEFDSLTDVSETEYHYSEEPQLQRFSRESWKRVTGTEDFKEDTEPASNESPSASRFTLSGPFVRIAAYVILGGLIALLLFYLLRNISPENKKVRPIAEPSLGSTEEIQATDAEALLSSAIAARDWRTAVRAYYLKLLASLAAAQWVQLKKDKSNYEYLEEIRSRGIPTASIERLTFAYEVTWFGEQQLSTDAFQGLEVDFKQALLEIQLKKQ